MKKVIIAAAILLAAGIATICWGTGNNGNYQKSTDNFMLTITNLGGLPQYGQIIVQFHNPDPTVSCTRYDSFQNGEYHNRIIGKENKEFWSWITVTVILGDSEYKAVYCGQQKDVTFTASDFHNMGWSPKCPSLPW